MTRRLLLIALIAIMPVTLAVIWVMQPIDPINQANFDRIQNGMTEPNVVQLLGNPIDEVERLEGIGDNREGETEVKTWIGHGRNTIMVWFVIKSSRRSVEHKECSIPDLWDYIKEWLDGIQLK